MPMLDATGPCFWDEYPNGAIVRDALGRTLRGVVACNPETGEVIAFVQFAPAGLLYVVRWWWGITRGSIPIDSSLFGIDVRLVRRHGFWPAPLTIKPRPWLHIGMD